MSLKLLGVPGYQLNGTKRDSELTEHAEVLEANTGMGQLMQYMMGTRMCR